VIDHLLEKLWNNTAETTVCIRSHQTTCIQANQHKINYFLVRSTLHMKRMVSHILFLLYELTILHVLIVVFLFHRSTVGPVHSVSCSPYHRNLFLSCGADGCISLYSLLQAKPLIKFDPSPTYIMSVEWSKIRPLVFSASSEDGTTYIYDLGQSLTKYVVEIHSNFNQGDTSDNDDISTDYNRRPSTTCLAFNPRQRALFATGNSNGTVHLW
jgi:WD40 repeat protein